MSKDENPSKRGINIKFIKELKLVSSFFIFNKLKNIIGRKKYIIFLFDIKKFKIKDIFPIKNKKIIGLKKSNLIPDIFLLDKFKLKSLSINNKSPLP